MTYSWRLNALTSPITLNLKPLTNPRRSFQHDEIQLYKCVKIQPGAVPMQKEAAMLTVNCWDEISCEWQQVELDLPEDCTPEMIAFTLDAQTSGVANLEDFHSIWEVRSYSRTGPILTIETRSSRNHLSILLVILETNPIVKPLAHPLLAQGLAHDPEEGF